MKIIASDYDGTLFWEDGTGISQADRDAIIKFRTQGGRFGIVTGRDMCACEQVLENTRGLLDFLICSTGAIICDGEGKIVSQQKSYATEAISQIADFSLAHNLKFFNVIDERTRYALDVSGSVKHNYRALDGFNNSTIWFNTIEDAIATEEYIREHHSDSLNYFRNFECIEITPLGVTKASAVRELIKQFDSPEVYTIGDGATDVPMILEFDGFAIDNGNPAFEDIRARRAKRVCDMINLILGDI